MKIMVMKRLGIAKKSLYDLEEEDFEVAQTRRAAYEAFANTQGLRVLVDHTHRFYYACAVTALRRAFLNSPRPSPRTLRRATDDFLNLPHCLANE
ncbi:hypothetical protein J6590_033657 [Homalodisca vitripennis]|nr:hypothetical protein J6590_033657 [Homalodisca vitripennis]